MRDARERSLFCIHPSHGRCRKLRKAHRREKGAARRRKSRRRDGRPPAKRSITARRRSVQRNAHLRQGEDAGGHIARVARHHRRREGAGHRAALRIRPLPDRLLNVVVRHHLHLPRAALHRPAKPVGGADMGDEGRADAHRRLHRRRPRLHQHRPSQHSHRRSAVDRLDKSLWTILLETFLYRKYAHIVTYVTVVLIIIGAILAAQAPSHRDGNATLGLASACIAVLCSASKAVFTHSAFKKFKSQMGAMPLLFWVDIFMLPFYIVATLILQSEGRPELVTFFGTRTHSRIHAHNTQTHHQHHLRAHTHNALSLSFLARAVECFQSAGLFWAMTFTAALGGARALAGFFVLSFVTATSTSTANILAQILNILVSIPLQHLVMPASMVVGVTTVIASVAFYAFIKAYKPFLPEVDAKLEANGLQVLMLTKLDVPSVPGAAALPGAEAKPAPS